MPRCTAVCRRVRHHVIYSPGAAKMPLHAMGSKNSACAGVSGAHRLAWRPNSVALIEKRGVPLQRGFPVLVFVDLERVIGVLASRYMASRLMRSIAHASSAQNIALVDAMSLTWFLLVLLVMVVLELLSSRSSLACPAAGGSRGGRRHHFFPLLDSMYASTDPPKPGASCRACTSRSLLTR